MKVLSPIGVLLMCVLGLRPQASQAQGTYVIKIASLAPEGTSWSEYARKFSRFVSEKTKGQAKVVWYFGGVEGDEPDVIRKIRMGQLQGGGFTIMGLGRMAPEVKVLELPFLFRSYDEVDDILTALGREFSDIFSRRGYALAGWLEVGFVHLFTGIPIRTVQDLARTKMWTWAGDSLAEAEIRSLGVSTIVPLALTDVLSSLQSGLINAFYGPLYGALAFQWHTRVKYMTDFALAYSPGAVVLDGRFYSSLPLPIRRVLDEGWRAFLPALKESIRQDERASLKVLTDYGIVVTHVNEESLDGARERAHALYERFSGDQYPPSLLAHLLDRLDRYRKLTRGASRPPP